jgi:uncharacterized protein (DUF1778 family)
VEFSSKTQRASVLAQREALHLDDKTRERFYSAMRAKPTPSTLLRQLMNEDDTRFKLVE